MENRKSQASDLPALGFVASMEEADRMLLGSFGEFLAARRGEHVITEGSTQDSLYLVISGMLHVRTAGKSHPVMLARLRTGDCIGEVNIFNPGRASATVTAADQSHLWRIDREMLDRFCMSHRAAASNLLIQISTQLSRRLRVTNEQLSIARETVTRTMP